MKKTLLYLFLLTVCISACNWGGTPPEIGVVLSEQYKNDVYKNFDTIAYTDVFKKKFDSLSQSFSNPKTMRAFYESNYFKPVLVTKFLPNGDLDSLNHYLNESAVHGINPEKFKVTEIEALIAKLRANQFKTVEETYPVIADLELLVSNAYINYHNYLKFGLVNPKSLYSRYYIKVYRPDSSSIVSLLHAKNMVDTLRADQPQSPQYKALQKALLVSKSEHEKRMILLNMERFRWKTPLKSSNYVEVNIPDFKLTWYNDLDTLIHMKVCVGERRERGYDEKLKAYLISRNLDDKPKNHETPMIYSELTSIQANPIWNIPVSIAQNEIYKQAIRDPYYLSNSNIKVYYKDKLINEPDTINWSRYSREKLPFKFKQGSGDGNALGKFKFIFQNSSSIYLHDTNNKNGFNFANRALSHGCIRIEKPLEFAELMVDNPLAYDKLRAEVDLPPIDSLNGKWYKKRMEAKADTLNVFKLKPAWFGPKKPIPLLITYYTAWISNGVLITRPDIYEMDEKLWLAIKKFR